MRETHFFEVYETQKGKRRVLLTKNLCPGKTVYDEDIIKEKDPKTGKYEEYRTWNPEKSKLAAAIKKGLQQTGIKPEGYVLYLGAASGTTVSHVSDIVGNNGFIFALDFAPRVLRDLYFVAEQRKNIVPIMADAAQPETYRHLVSGVDIVYQDVAQRNQLEIFLKNCKMFLKKGGYGLLALKARSVDVTKNPKSIFKQVRAELEKEMIVVDYRELDPFEQDHAFFVCKKK